MENDIIQCGTFHSSPSLLTQDARNPVCDNHQLDKYNILKYYIRSGINNTYQFNCYHWQKFKHIILYVIYKSLFEKIIHFCWLLIMKIAVILNIKHKLLVKITMDINLKHKVLVKITIDHNLIRKGKLDSLLWNFE